MKTKTKIPKLRKEDVIFLLFCIINIYLLPLAIDRNIDTVRLGSGLVFWYAEVLHAFGGSIVCILLMFAAAAYSYYAIKKRMGDSRDRPVWIFLFVLIPLCLLTLILILRGRLDSVDFTGGYMPFIFMAAGIWLGRLAAGKYKNGCYEALAKLEDKEQDEIYRFYAVNCFALASVPAEGAYGGNKNYFYRHFKRKYENAETDMDKFTYACALSVCGKVDYYKDVKTLADSLPSDGAYAEIKEYIPKILLNAGYMETPDGTLTAANLEKGLKRRAMPNRPMRPGIRRRSEK